MSDPFEIQLAHRKKINPKSINVLKFLETDSFFAIIGRQPHQLSIFLFNQNKLMIYFSQLVFQVIC